MIAPWRTGLPGRPDLPVPPAPMPLFRGGRPLKRWRWVGCFDDNVMLCAAIARIGPLPVCWWAVWDRKSKTLAENTLRGGHAVALDNLRVTVEDGPVRIDLAITEPAGVETISPHGAEYIWTRKTLTRATGVVTLGDKRFEVDAPGLIDDSGGYHARDTAWQWSAGIGENTEGQAVAWNVCVGLHDAAEASERTVWVDGVPHEIEPQSFNAELTKVGGLDFQKEASRVHKENLWLVATDYEQPFGTFTGSLPGAGRLRYGLGVMERHSVRW